MLFCIDPRIITVFIFFFLLIPFAELIPSFFSSLLFLFVEYRIAHVSEDHNLLRQDETKRIEEAKGRIINKTGANPRVIPSNAIPHQEVMNKKLGLGNLPSPILFPPFFLISSPAMSRSLGHVTLSRFGGSHFSQLLIIISSINPLLLSVISEPDFLSCSVVNADILVLASDGISFLYSSSCFI